MKKTVLFTILTLFLLPNLALAGLDIDISIKNSFTISETVSFDYTVTSDVNQNITFFPHINCPNAPIALLQERTIQLQAGKPYTNTYTNIKVEDWIEPQTCTAYVQILSPVQQYVSKNFTINTNPSFSFEIKTCKDVNCQEKAKVFSQGQNIYLSYDSSVANPTITATLTYPNKTTQTINIPSSIKVSQIGTYNLEVTASKPGYKTITKKLQFGVIEEEVVIPTEKVTPSEKAPAEEKVPPAKEPTERPPEVEAKIKELKAKILEIQQKIVQLLILLIQLLQQKL